MDIINGRSVKTWVLIAFSLLMLHTIQAATNVNFLRAKAFESIYKLDSAKVYFQRALDKEPENVVFLEHYAALLLATKQTDAALIVYEKMNRIQAGAGNLGLAKCYAIMGRKDEMFKILKKYMESPYKGPPAIVRLDSILIRYQYTSEWNNFWEQEWYNRTDYLISETRAMLNQGDFLGIVNSLSNLQTNKLRHELLYCRAVAFMNLQNYSSAMNDINNALEQSRKPDEYYALKASLLIQQKKYDEAATNYAEAIERVPWKFDYYLLRTKTLRLAGKDEEALEQINMLVGFLPDNINALYEKGLVHLDLDQSIKALECLNKCIKYNPINYQYLYARALALRQSGLIKPALRDLDRGLSINPSCDSLWFEKGEIMFSTGNKKTACECWREAEKRGNIKAITQVQVNCR
jgi:tetratricopeptide (TPR) repeat protein